MCANVQYMTAACNFEVLFFCEYKSSFSSGSTLNVTFLQAISDLHGSYAVTSQLPDAGFKVLKLDNTQMR